ncbi:uridine diphosphate-N-acetylglucosamine-binding protein YvcK [Candidatus Bipolaricaulota bacterium]|nr:uridine diphosphate-N-acetylglucosamine-binding protein YvcK [Candidatus Bipolaricaulota bacterium]
MLRWLTPGMRVKRWVALLLAGAILLVIAIDDLSAGRFIAALHDAQHALPPAWEWLINTLMILLGIAALSVGLSRLLRSVARGVAPGSSVRASEHVYRTRILERAPNVVCIGGGTGMSTVLRGLKTLTTNLTAVVAVMDDGGSSGRIREELDMLPPGDIRNCLVALAEDEQRIAHLFQHRFTKSAPLQGHSLGNLLLAGLTQATGSFDRAIEEMSHILDVRGRVLPATLADTHLVAIMDDRARVVGETAIANDPRCIREVFLDADNVSAYEPVLDAIRDADLIILGPGSLYTSLIPNLLVKDIAAVVEAASAEKILVANLMTQPGETDGYTLRDHLSTLNRYVRLQRFDAIIVNAAPLSPSILERYREEAAGPVLDDLTEPNAFGVRIIREPILGELEIAGKLTAKHDPLLLAKAIARHARSFTQRGSWQRPTP